MASNTWGLQSQILQSQLKDIRKSAGMTQMELANRLQKHQSYVSKYESGERRLDLIELRDIILCCDATLNSFVKEFEKRIKKGI
jgi:transcriptional regulator with XRE-family HTH domain